MKVTKRQLKRIIQEAVNRESLIRYIANELANRAADLGILDDIFDSGGSADEIFYNFPEKLTAGLPDDSDGSELAMRIAKGDFDYDLHDFTVTEDDLDDSVTGTYYEHGVQDAEAGVDKLRYKYSSADPDDPRPILSPENYSEYVKGFNDALEDLDDEEDRRMSRWDDHYDELEFGQQDEGKKLRITKSRLQKIIMEEILKEATDTDGDGTPDYRDTDSDDDGISDAEESKPSSSGSAGISPEIMKLIDEAESKGWSFMHRVGESIDLGVFGPDEYGVFDSAKYEFNPSSSYWGPCGADGTREGIVLRVDGMWAPEYGVGFGEFLLEFLLEYASQHGGLISARDMNSKQENDLFMRLMNRSDVEAVQLDDWNSSLGLEDRYKCDQGISDKSHTHWQASPMSKLYKKSGTPVMDELEKRGMLKVR